MSPSTSTAAALPDPSALAEDDRAWAAARAGAAETASAAALLAEVAARFGDGAVIATSFGVEDIVLLHLAREHAPGLTAFTIDTGRLPAETFEVMEEVRVRLGVRVETLVPDHRAVQALVDDGGWFSFRDSREARQACCAVRKLEPLRRALAGRRAWLTGLRREQGVTRTATPALGWDDAHGLVKANPLASWTKAQVWAHVREHRLPYNRLHDAGYPSIGCAPCTRAVKPYEDDRAGRWWWESDEHRECGLHRR
ncbi:MAG TPA: phosphoadenylyl-sulfate reductase [Kofleriaceae bacterium]|nr:phosphoadenylyl-sulfate reductase [Kofleriaceae bacterium]